MGKKEASSTDTVTLLTTLFSQFRQHLADSLARKFSESAKLAIAAEKEAKLKKSVSKGPTAIVRNRILK